MANGKANGTSRVYLSKTERRLRDIINHMKEENIHSAPLEDICNTLNCSPGDVKEAMETLKDDLGIKFKFADKQSIPEEFQPQLRGPSKTEHSIIKPSTYDYSTFKYGSTADTHLGSPHTVDDIKRYKNVLKSVYKYWRDQGIEYVFHAGNWIDGDARFNQFETKKRGFTAQLDILLQEYPQVDGITTILVPGEDHEGWAMRNFGAEVGRHAAESAHFAGRHDLHFTGFLEADIVVVPRAGKGNTSGIFYNRHHPIEEHDQLPIPTIDDKGKVVIMKGDKPFLKPDAYAIITVKHGGGGTGYATSYIPQKTVGSLEEGEKSQILHIGHYHKTGYDYIRNTHVYQEGCMERQSVFMRKKIIRAHMGNWQHMIHQDQTGAIIKVDDRYIPFSDAKPNFTLQKYSISDGK